MQAVNTWDEVAVQTVIDSRKAEQGALLPILHGIQDAIGYIPPETVPLIADGLNLSRAEVHGVISYYHHFRTVPAGRQLVQVCRAEACQARGADALIAHVHASLGCDFHETTADGEVSLEPAYCLGQCSIGPAIQIGERLHARVTPERFDALVNAKRGTQ